MKNYSIISYLKTKVTFLKINIIKRNWKFCYDLKTEFIALHTFMGFQYFLQFGAKFWTELRSNNLLGVKSFYSFLNSLNESKFIFRMKYLNTSFVFVYHQGNSLRLNSEKLYERFCLFFAICSLLGSRFLKFQNRLKFRKLKN